MESSLALVLQELQALVLRYRVVLNSIFEGKEAPESVQKIAMERQMAFLVRITNAMFSYGMPTSNGKLKVKYVDASASVLIRSRYDDFSVCGSLIVLLGDLNKALELPQGRMADVDLEVSLLNFILCFRQSVLGDPKLITFGRTTKQDALNSIEGQAKVADSDENDEYVSAYNRIETETVQGLDAIAEMMEAQNMKAIMESFAQKMLLNLAYSHKARVTEDSKRIVNCSLDILGLFLQSG